VKETPGHYYTFEVKPHTVLRKTWGQSPNFGGENHANVEFWGLRYSVAGRHQTSAGPFPSCDSGRRLNRKTGSLRQKGVLPTPGQEWTMDDTRLGGPRLSFLKLRQQH
jgi:hypothetical protein